LTSKGERFYKQQIAELKAENARLKKRIEELDIDGDGVDRAKSVPWDVFPLDPKEWRDTDGDGIGDNADLDDDNDGYSDRVEREKRPIR